MRNNNGIVFGKNNFGKVVKKENEDGHVLVIGSPASGKSNCIAVPTLMNWKNRAFVIDVKGELFRKTKKARGEDTIKVFNPSDISACNYDPYCMLKNNLCDSAHEIAENIIPLTERNNAIINVSEKARDYLCGAIIYFYKKGMDFPETMISIAAQTPRSLVSEIIEHNDGDAIRYISQFDSMSDETVDYVFSEVYANISSFATDKMLIKALRRSDKSITPEDLENGYDVFVCGHVYTKLQMMIINQFCKFFEQREKTEPILFLMDEFQNFGKIENFAAYLDVLNNEKIEVMIFIHSKKQLDVIYGKDQADKICNNCTYKVILQVYDPVTQKWCSELAGICEKLRHKKLMQPEEFGDLEDVFCIFPTGCCRIKKIKYWEEELFKKTNTLWEEDKEAIMEIILILVVAIGLVVIFNTKFFA